MRRDARRCDIFFPPTHPDLDGLSKLVQAAVCCLLWERYAEAWYNSIMPRVDLLRLNSVLLALYVVWALAHQAYTLYHEHSWQKV